MRCPRIDAGVGLEDAYELRALQEERSRASFLYKRWRGSALTEHRAMSGREVEGESRGKNM